MVHEKTKTLFFSVSKQLIIVFCFLSYSLGDLSVVTIGSNLELYNHISTTTVFFLFNYCCLDISWVAGIKAGRHLAKPWRPMTLNIVGELTLNSQPQYFCTLVTITWVEAQSMYTFVCLCRHVVSSCVRVRVHMLVYNKLDGSFTCFFKCLILSWSLSCFPEFWKAHLGIRLLRYAKEEKAKGRVNFFSFPFFPLLPLMVAVLVYMV